MTYKILQLFNIFLFASIVREDRLAKNKSLLLKGCLKILCTILINKYVTVA